MIQNHPGSVINMKIEGNRPVRKEGIEVADLGHVQKYPTQFVRKISGVSRSSAHRILKHVNFIHTI